MKSEKLKIIKKIKIQTRVRSKIRGTSERPRLSVFRSNKHFYAQLIDDNKRITIMGFSEKHIGGKELSPKQKAKELGKLLAQKALGKKIKEVVFDKGEYKYHGIVKEVAEGAREGGLIF